GAIEPEMLRKETARASRKGPESLTAWDLILRGMWHFHKFAPEDQRRARELFRKAVEAAPDLAEGYTWRARCNSAIVFLRMERQSNGRFSGSKTGGFERRAARRRRSLRALRLRRREHSREAPRAGHGSRPTGDRSEPQLCAWVPRNRSGTPV